MINLSFEEAAEQMPYNSYGVPNDARQMSGKLKTAFVPTNAGGFKVKTAAQKKAEYVKEMAELRKSAGKSKSRSPRSDRGGRPGSSSSRPQSGRPGKGNLDSSRDGLSVSPNKVGSLTDRSGQGYGAAARYLGGTDAADVGYDSPPKTAPARDGARFGEPAVPGQKFGGDLDDRSLLNQPAELIEQYGAGLKASHEQLLAEIAGGELF